MNIYSLKEYTPMEIMDTVFSLIMQSARQFNITNREKGTILKRLSEKAHPHPQLKCLNQPHYWAAMTKIREWARGVGRAENEASLRGQRGRKEGPIVAMGMGHRSWSE